MVGGGRASREEEGGDNDLRMVVGIERNQTVLSGVGGEESDVEYRVGNHPPNRHI
jgi:hypothetical protein